MMQITNAETLKNRVPLPLPASRAVASAGNSPPSPFGLRRGSLCSLRSQRLEGAGKLLLHSCCAPCSGEIMEALCATGATFTVYYYNPNIFPREEYERRKADNQRFAEKLGVPFVDADYDNDNWQARVKGLENEPERGARCAVCFSLRLERAALYAHDNGFDVLATSLGMSRWKNLEQVNACGRQAVERYPGLRFWDYNWRIKGGADRRFVIAKREGFYQQKYCGCIYSLRKVNECRTAEGLEIAENPTNTGGKKG